MFIKKLNEIFDKSSGDLTGFIKNSDFTSLKGVEYRFSKESDIVPIFEILSKLYKRTTHNEKDNFDLACSSNAYVYARCNGGSCFC